MPRPGERYDTRRSGQAQVGGEKRPVLVLTRPEVIDVRTLVTVAEITTAAPGLTVEVEIDLEADGDADLERASVINCDGLHTIAQSTLTTHVGAVDDETMRRVCSAVTYAIGC